MTLASVTAWFIVIVCASVLFKNGIKEINNAADAARALEPLVHGFPNAGLVAKLIFSFGIIGLGLLAVPVFSWLVFLRTLRDFRWREGLYRKLRRAVGFYGIITVATLVGLSINFLASIRLKALYLPLSLTALPPCRCY